MPSLVPPKAVALSVSLLMVWIIALQLHREAPFKDLHDALSNIYTVAASSGSVSSSIDPSSPSSSSQAKEQQHQQGQKPKPQYHAAWDISTFKRKWLSTELGGDFDGFRLKQLCVEQVWRDDVVLQMLHSRGGIGNVRGTILDFLYFSIHAGVHIVLPGYVKRTDATLDWIDESNGYYPFDNMFDTEWFMRIMNIQCPQMHIYPTTDDVPNGTVINSEYTMPTARSDKQARNNDGALMANFKEWLGDQPEYVAEELNLVNVSAPIWNFDLYPQPRLRTTFGRLLKVSPRIRELAATAVFNMRSDLYLGIEPGDQLHRDAYYGVHLRTEVDAENSGWLRAYGGFDVQTDLHIEMCKSLGLEVMYVASGNQEDVDRFAEKAYKNDGIAVVSKKDLLSEPQQREALENLTWDQQGALDWEILSRSSFFNGPMMSSFSWNIALRRYFYTDDGDRLRRENPYAIQEDEAQVTYDDGLSRLIFRTPPERLLDFSLEMMAPGGMFP
ncbi:hypothetical protein SLS53_003935 [Cytospora paraplurivora]|uniref:Alternative oxidase n=1 Tax=Cytospora paraplurivora TaxID=2898453 RepID=A0AAN9YGI9_9PEZI